MSTNAARRVCVFFSLNGRYNVSNSKKSGVEKNSGENNNRKSGTCSAADGGKKKREGRSESFMAAVVTSQSHKVQKESRNGLGIQTQEYTHTYKERKWRRFNMANTSICKYGHI